MLGFNRGSGGEGAESSEPPGFSRIYEISYRWCRSSLGQKQQTPRFHLGGRNGGEAGRAELRTSLQESPLQLYNTKSTGHHHLRAGNLVTSPTGSGLMIGQASGLHRPYPTVCLPNPNVSDLRHIDGTQIWGDYLPHG